MTIKLNNPDSPATKKQLWLLHILTKTDTRNLDITMSEASKRIESLKGNNKGRQSQGDTARADYRVSGTRPLVNPHTSAITRDKQLKAQLAYDKKNPKPEVAFTQGIEPKGESDIDKIRQDFIDKCYQQGYDFANNQDVNPNPDVRVDFYDFQCKDCLFGKSGICEPKWTRAGFMTCLAKNIVESVSFNCVNHEPIRYSISDYCHRPKGKQCHRKKIDNKCLECAYRKPIFRDGYNHSAWARYIPTMQDRIKHHSYWLDKFDNNPEALAQVRHMIELISKLA